MKIFFFFGTANKRSIIHQRNLQFLGTEIFKMKNRGPPGFKKAFSVC